MANTGNSDALLMSMHRHRIQQHRNLLGSSQAGALPAGRGPDPLNLPPGRGPDPLSNLNPTTSVGKSMSQSVMDKLNRNNNLTRELDTQYGKDARKMAVQQYSQYSPDPQKPRLIEQVLSQRNKEYTRKQEANAEDLRTLNELRGNLIDQQEKFNRRKVVHERRKEYLEKSYNGEMGPHTYHQWQMEHYHSAKGVVDDITDKFLDQFFRSEPGVPSGTRSEHDRVTKAKITQLLMEELVLETTSELSKGVAREVKNSFLYVKNKTDLHFMQQAEDDGDDIVLDW